MQDRLCFGDIEIEVVRKRVRNINLTITPPLGRVRISAPRYVSFKAIKAFAQSRLEWIRENQIKIRSQEYAPALRYVDGETHYLWGDAYRLKIVRDDVPITISLEADALAVRTRYPYQNRKIQAALDEWYAGYVKAAATPLFAYWEPIMQVKVKRFGVRKMTSLWGSCTPSLQTIRLNSELAKHSPECLEYIVVHEMVHLLEASHNHRFKSLMTQFMPGWESIQAKLHKVNLRTC